MAVLNSYRFGIREAARRPKIALLLWVVNLAAALLVASVLAGPLAAYFGGSLALDDLMASFDLNTLLEFIAAESGVVADVVGMLLPVLLVYVLLWPFFQGGILHGLGADGGRGDRSAAAFFAGGAKYYGRFLRLAFASLIYWIPAGVVYVFLGPLLGLLAPDPDAEQLRFVLLLVRIVLGFVLFHFVRMILDYARILIVRRNERSVLRALLGGGRFVVGRIGRTSALFGLFLLTALAFLLGFGWMRFHWMQTTPAAVAGVFILTQVLAYARSAVRIAAQAGQWRFFGLFEPAKGAGGQGDHGFDQVQNTAHGDAEQLEGKENKPDDGVEEDGQQGQGPADHQKDEP